MDDLRAILLPHANTTCREADAELTRIRAECDRLRAVIEWALGEGDDFPMWPYSVTITGNPKFWWRKELRKRFDAATGSDGK